MARKRKRRQDQLAKRYRISALIGLLLTFFSISRLGFVGRLSANLVRFFVGDMHIILSLLLFICCAYMLFKGAPPKIKNGRRMTGIMILFLSILTLMHSLLFSQMTYAQLNPLATSWRLFFSDFRQNLISQQLGGGMIGAVFYSLFHFLFDQLGTYVVLALLIFSAGLLIFNVSYGEFFQWMAERITSLSDWLGQVIKGRSSKKTAPAKQKPAKEKEKQKKEQQPDPMKDEQAEREKVKIQSHKQDRPVIQASYPDPQESGSASPTVGPEGEKEESGGDGEFEIVSEAENEDYQLPPLSLLNEVQATDQSNEYDVIEKNIEKLEETFDSFDVDAKVVKANLGPAVTKYEIQPATGVKVSKIVNLQDDIALALAAKDIRIEAPIPGRALIGIEVPNQDVSFISFRETMELSQRDPKHLLEVPLGKDISGQIQMADLAKMPHTLIAGSTGSGKSVAINSIITSLLMRTKPNEVKLMMIDPKMVELSDYNGIPHLLTPVVTNPKKAARALNNVVKEMERRYELFASTGTKNRATYNEYVRQYNLEEGKELPLLPYIVVIVDELADLMMVASKEVEDAIMRLAQMARAAGIHMILATQRPSVDVLTGTIKANVPSRIAFAVSSGTDSRTILDMTGAEKLLGKGDMLYLPMGASQPKRVQGTFITDDEVKRVVEFVKDEQEVNYVEEMAPSEEADSALADEPEDEYFNEAVELVVEAESASVSMLQRRFRIGYNRAARMIDDMEARGIVGPANGSKPREVLIETTDPTTEDNESNLE